jgi:putative transposase
MPTVWEVSEEAWSLIERVLDEVYPKKVNGHRRVDLHRVLNGIIFRLRSGCQWNHLPREYGDDSTVHRHFQKWCSQGVFERIWAVLIAECEELGGVKWEWQAVDGGGPHRAQPH